MKSFNLIELRLEEMSVDELVLTDGGSSAPSKDTSFAYDVAYYTSMFGRGVVEFFKYNATHPIRPSEYR